MAYAGITAAFGLTPLAARTLALFSLTLAVGVATGAVLWRAAQIRDKGCALAPGHRGGPGRARQPRLPAAMDLPYGPLVMLVAAVRSAWPRALAPIRDKYETIFAIHSWRGDHAVRSERRKQRRHVENPCSLAHDPSPSCSSSTSLEARRRSVLRSDRRRQPRGLGQDQRNGTGHARCGHAAIRTG